MLIPVIIVVLIITMIMCYVASRENTFQCVFLSSFQVETQYWESRRLLMMSFFQAQV